MRRAPRGGPPRVVASAAMKLAVAVVLAALASCNEPKVANRCAGEVEPHCLTRVVCAPDRERGCEVCTCDSPFPASSAAPEMPPVR